MQLQMVEERFKVQQIEIRLEEIINTASFFLDRTQDILETLQGRMTWVETSKNPPTDVPPKYLETIKLEYELIEFASKVAEEILKTVKKTKSVCVEFCRRFLLTYNQCHISASRRLEVLSEHEIFLKQLQERCSEDEHAIQLVKRLDEEVLKTEIAHAAVSSHLLEDQLFLIQARAAGIKPQATKHEITIIFLEPSSFENIVANANAWRKFMNEQAEPS